MKYNFEIQFKRQCSQTSIHTLEFSYDAHDFVDRLAQRYGQDTVGFLKYVISRLEQPDTDTRSRITQENENLKKSNQTLEKRVQEVEQELEEAQGKLSVATTRLRGLNVNPNLAGGGSRSDQLRKDFCTLKNSLHDEPSTKVLEGWQSQDFKSSSKTDYKSEEFYKIKSILSQQVFCGGMAHFAKDKAEIDDALILIMEELSGIGSISSTPAIFQEIQERVKAGLLRSKDVDNSDEALMSLVVKTTQLIDQDLPGIAKCQTTEEALSEIKKFVKSGLRLVRDIVNDPNSGELFMPESGAAFDESAHETRDDIKKDKIKMTICAGYRVAGNVLVKAEVITCDPDHSPQPNEVDQSYNSASQSTDLPNFQQGDPQNHQATGDQIGSEDNPDSEDSPSQNASLGESISTDGQAASTQAISENADQNQGLIEQEDSPVVTTRIFTGKVTSTEGVFYRSKPHKDSGTDTEAKCDDNLSFDGWIIVDSSEEKYKKWYKIAGADYWVPAIFIEGGPPTDLQPMSSEGVSDASK